MWSCWFMVIWQFRGSNSRLLSNGWSHLNSQSSGHSSADFTTVSQYSLRRTNYVVVSLSVQKGNTPLHVGALGGHVPVVRMLVENGANINAKSQVFMQRPAIFILHSCVKTRLCSVSYVESVGKLH